MEEFIMVRVDYSGFDWSILGNKINKTCKYCGYKHLIHYDKRDVDFCPSCNKWMDKASKNPSCYFCRGREKTPIEELRLIQYRNRADKI